MPIKQNLFKRYFNFDGKRFEIRAIRNNEDRARKLAEGLKHKGLQVRIIQYSCGVPKWAIYVRRLTRNG